MQGNVSVPYRGATFLNTKTMNEMKNADGFPSPIGELHFSIVQWNTPDNKVDEFPSPIGELHFSIKR